MKYCITRYIGRERALGSQFVRCILSVRATLSVIKYIGLWFGMDGGSVY